MATVEKSGTNSPPLFADHSFLGMVATQFLGAFNDNVFKQLVILISLDLALTKGLDADYFQPQAMIIFSLPFVLFSGFAGFLSDRFSKQRIFVLCKVAEIVIMFLGMLAFMSGRVNPLFAVLFLMGMHSAFFGPAKFGILPEMLRERDLPMANGIVQMTTFLAIILGIPLGGYLKQIYPNSLWRTSEVCIGIAVVGTITSLLVRYIPAARPGMKLEMDSLFVSRDVIRQFRVDRTLMGVLLVYAYFWFIAGIVNPAVNALGKLQLGAGDFDSSIMSATVAIGITIGCPIAAILSQKKISFQTVSIGAWGLSLCLGVLGLAGRLTEAPAVHTVLFGTVHLENLHLAVDEGNRQFAIDDQGKIIIETEKKKFEQKVPRGAEVVVHEGEKLIPGAKLFSRRPYADTVLSPADGIVHFVEKDPAKPDSTPALEVTDDAGNVVGREPLNGSFEIRLRENTKATKGVPVGYLINPPILYMRAAEGLLILIGIFTGFMAVPLQVALQVLPPNGEKGQVMGAMNFSTWLGIFISSGFYFGCAAVFDQFGFRPSAMFVVTAVLMLPVAIFYRPKDITLE